MTIRNFFVWTLLLVTLSPTLAQGTEKSNQAKRPNLLFLFADDWGRHASAYAKIYGSPSISAVVHTPNIDRIARQGVLFRNAFVNAPSCTPCRSALLTGRYFFRTGRGAILQGAVWDESIPTWPLLLRDAGYFIGKMYKVWSPGTPRDAPFGGTKYAYEKNGHRYNQFSQTVTRLVNKGKSVKAAKAILLKEVRDNFGDFLKAKPKEKPFCFWFGPTLVHRKFQKGSGQKIWGINPDNLKGKLPKFLPDVPVVRADLVDYLGEVQAWDAGIGVILQMLAEAGELENTIIIVSGDHGTPGVPGGKCNLYDFGVGVPLLAMGPGIPRGRVVDDFANLMDLAPTFLEYGGVTIPKGVQGRSLVNVLKSKKSGLVDPKRTWVVTGRERHVAAARDKFLPYPQRALRTKDILYIRNFKPSRWPMGDPKAVTAEKIPPLSVLETNTFVAFADMDASPTRTWLITQRNNPKWQWHYKYAFGKRPGEELYDLSKDPDQINNVAADPAYDAIRKKMAARLLQILRDAEDPRVVGDGQTFERPPFTTGFQKKKGKGKKK